MWKTNTSDVYIATRTLGGTMKASLHASGRCHLRAPDPQYWRGAGQPPTFLDAWNIDPASDYEFPFSVVIPATELRHGDWPKHRDKGTVWIEATGGEGAEVAIFLLRTKGEVSDKLVAAGWHTCIVDVLLPDERRLLVVAGNSAIPEERVAEIDEIKRKARAVLAENSSAVGNPRLLLVAGPNEQSTRKFVEAAVC